MPVQGLWNAFGVNIPDFGISEKLGVGPRNAAVSLGGQSNPLQTNSTVQVGGQTVPTYSLVPGNYQTLENRDISGTSYTSGGGSSSGGGSTLSLREQMERGLIPWDDNLLNSPTNSDYANQVRNDINSGYNSYFSELDNILNVGLPSQRTAQEGIVNSQYDQGVNTLGTQKTLGLQDLNNERTRTNTQQAKNLQDLTSNIRNLFQSGNVYLGARGAADSSASNQYAYALTKLGSQQRGDLTAKYADIHNDINGRESRLNEIYNSEVNNLASERDQKINGIVQWFGEQQNALRQAQAQGKLSQGQDLASLSKDLLNVALQNLQNVQAESANRRSALDQWAMNNSQNINQLKSNLAQVSTTNYSMPTVNPIGGQPAVEGGRGNPSLYGFGAAEDRQRTNIFGQPIV